MKKRLAAGALIGAACFLLATFSNAGAATFSFDTSALAVNTGDSFSVNLLLDGQGMEVGGFDVDIAYDTTQMMFTGYSLGGSLGDLSFFDAGDWSWGDLGGGVIDLAETSYLTTAELQALQPGGAFQIATLDFTCLAGGSSTLSLTQADWTDGAGAFYTGSIGNSVTVTQTGNAPVPEPTTMLLFGVGLAGAGIFGRKKSSKC